MLTCHSDIRVAAMAVSLSDLPTELLIRIFCDLNVSDLVSCQLTHSSLCTIIRDSVVLSYRKALQLAGAEDNPSSKLAISERLELLNARENAWRDVRIDFKQNIEVNYNTSGIYDLTGGVYLLGDDSRRAFHYFTLPTKSSDVTKWSKIDVERNIIDMAFAIYEHDLLAIVTSFVLHLHIKVYASSLIS
jgi:F-box-like